MARPALTLGGNTNIQNLQSFNDVKRTIVSVLPVAAGAVCGTN